MSAKTIVVLLVVAVLGCLFVVGLEQGWFGEKPDAGSGQQDQMTALMPQQESEAKDLFEDHPAEISRLAIASRDLTVTFVKDGEDWRIEEPVKAPAVKWQVDSIARALGGLQYVRKIEPGSQSDADMGLDEPTAAVSFEYEGGEAVLKIGKKVLLKDHTYVRLGDEAGAYVVTANMEETLGKELKDFREAELASFRYDEARGLEIVRRDPPQTLRLVKQEDGDWVIDSPVKTRAERGEASDLVTSVSGLRAQEFVDDNPEDLDRYGLEDPYLRIKVTLRKELEEDKEEEGDEEAEEPTTQPEEEPKYEYRYPTLLIGGFVGLQKSRRYAKLEDSTTVVAVNQSQIDKLAGDVKGIRDVRVPVANTYKMTKMTVSDRQDSVTMEKGDRKWTIISPEKMEAEYSAVNEFIAGIRKLIASDFIDYPEDLAKYGLDDPQLEIKLYMSDQVEPDHILIGDKTPSGRMLYVMRVGEDSVAVVKTEKVESIFVSPAAFGSRTMLSLPKAQIEHFELTRPDGRFVVHKDDWQWRIVEPHDAAADAAGVTKIVNGLASLRARRIISKGRLEQYGLDRPDVKVVAEVSPPKPPTTTQAAPAVPAEPEKHEVAFSRQENKVYAVLAGKELVYEVSSSVYDNLVAELHDRKVMRFSPLQVALFKIAGKAGEMEFAKDGEQWSYVLDEFVQLDKEKVDTYLRELRTMDAQRFVDLSVTDVAQYGLDEPAMRVDVTLENGSMSSLLVSAVGPKDAGERYAMVDGQDQVFVISSEQADKLEAELGDFEKE
jgi:hypothetical protein